MTWNALHSSYQRMASSEKEKERNRQREGREREREKERHVKKVFVNRKKQDIQDNIFYI